MVIKYLLMNLKRLHWLLFLARTFSLPVDRDIIFFIEEVSDHGPWQINMNHWQRNRILASWNSTFKALNEETCHASVLIKETNAFTFIFENGKGRSKTLPVLILPFIKKKRYTGLALLVLLEYLLNITMRVHAGKHTHTHTHRHNSELCVGSQAAVTHVPWAAISYEGTGKSQCND